ncbi:MAG: hypothetical protein WDN28_26330 [Chthoniobacter sp.]
MGGLPTDENARLCADSGAALLIMHTVGEPKVAHTHIGYDDIMGRLEDFFTAKIALAEGVGVAPRGDRPRSRHRFREAARRQLAHLSRARSPPPIRPPDPAAGFRARPSSAKCSACPTLPSAMRVPSPASSQGMLHGAHLFRVHNVRAAVQAVRIIAAVEGAG